MPATNSSSNASERRSAIASNAATTASMFGNEQPSRIKYSAREIPNIPSVKAPASRPTSIRLSVRDTRSSLGTGDHVNLPFASRGLQSRASLDLNLYLLSIVGTKCILSELTNPLRSGKLRQNRQDMFISNGVHNLPLKPVRPILNSVRI